jgi:hypothetical protein
MQSLFVALGSYSLIFLALSCSFLLVLSFALFFVLS